MPSDYEIANTALDLLNVRGPNFKPRTRHLLLSTCQDNGWDVAHLHFRNVMNRLYSAGVVDRYGIGQFRWSIKPGVVWDRSNPFKRQTNAPPAPKPDEGDTPPRPTKDQLEDYQRIRDQLVAVKTHRDALQKELASGRQLWDAQKEVIADLQRKLANANQKVRVVKVEHYDGTTTKIKGLVLPKAFDRTKQLAECRRNILLVGPAGAGKSYLAKLVADILKLEFGSLSCTAGMSEAHLLGRSVPDLTHGKNRFQGTDFLRRYEEGGVFLLDELDAADPNLLLCVNTGLANGYLNVPNRPDKARAVKHEDFVCIATANTSGRGATRMYAGRNQLDEATIDRFRIGQVEVYYDPAVEAAVCPDLEGGWVSWTSPNGHATTDDRTIMQLVNRKYDLRDTCQFIRHKIEASGLRRIMSTRFMADAHIMMSVAKWTMSDVLTAFFSSWTDEEKAKIC